MSKASWATSRNKAAIQKTQKARYFGGPFSFSAEERKRIKKTITRIDAAMDTGEWALPTPLNQRRIVAFFATIVRIPLIPLRNGHQSSGFPLVAKLWHLYVLTKTELCVNGVIMKKAFSAALLGMTLLASPAAAATYNVSTQPGGVFGVQDWQITSSFSAGGDPARTGTFKTGAFQLMANGLGNFVAFCLQPLENLNLSKVYADGTSLVDPSLSDLNTLMANAFFDVNNAVSAAAFQMAVWELAHDAGDYDIDDGFFKVTTLTQGTDEYAAATQAQAWLDKVNGDQVWADNALGKNFLIISASGTQDLLTNIDNSSLVGEVPLPASGLLLLAGLGGIGVASRRKARKAA